MVWGTHSARRAPSPLPAVDAPPRPTAVCECEATAFLINGKLPLGWEAYEDPAVPTGQSARCPPCARLADRQAGAGPAQGRVGHLHRGRVAVPDEIPTGPLYTGARIYHWLVGGNAVLRIHGGAAARPPGRDEPIHFLATPADLEHLIIHLAEIRAALAKGAPDNA